MYLPDFIAIKVTLSHRSSLAKIAHAEFYASGFIQEDEDEEEEEEGVARLGFLLGRRVVVGISNVRLRRSFASLAASLLCPHCLSRIPPSATDEAILPWWPQCPIWGFVLPLCGGFFSVSLLAIFLVLQAKPIFRQ